MSELLKVVSEMSGENIPMQRPMSSEKNELKTWFFAFPFQTDDFVLSVSVDEKNFFAATSKSFVQSLSAKLAAAEPDASATGAVFRMDFVLLNKYLNGWLTLLNENADAVFGADSPAAEDFKEAQPMIKRVLEGTSELKSLSAHIREENGTVRSSFHLETAQ